MAKFQFLVTRGMDDPVRVTRAFMLAKAAKEKGHDVSIFLSDDAVLLAKPGHIDFVSNPTGDEAVGAFTFLLNQGVKLNVCLPCANARNISEQDLVEGAVFAKAPELIEDSVGAQIFTF